MNNAKGFKALITRYGGWERIMSPDFDLTEDILVEFESIGISKQVMISTKRKFGLPKSREQVLQDIATAVYGAFSSTVRGQGLLNEAKPDLNQYLSHYETPRMLEFEITKEDIITEILSKPERYPPPKDPPKRYPKDVIIKRD